MKIYIKNNWHLLVLWFWILLNIIITARLNIFKYNNFDFGKFDLGNMTQMVWNTLHGRFMYLTDYFGANVPRWAMSHVDPIILLNAPFFLFFQHPLVLVFIQFITITLSAVTIYKISYLRLESKNSALLISLAFLFYPSIGYINAMTGYHGVSAAIPFFLIAFYLYEKMYKEGIYPKRTIILFWIMLIITMSGKEQLPLYVALYGVFIIFLRQTEKINFSFSLSYLKTFFKQSSSITGLSMVIVGLLWFITAFFIVIPAYSHYRVDGYQRFSESLSIGSSENDVSLPNYFLGRYEEFGGSYTEVIKNMIINNKLFVSVFFGGDKLQNLNRTLGPVMYLPLAYPALFVLAVPDLMINYLTTSDGVGTAEIENHRISMIIPVLFISSVYAVAFLSELLKKKQEKYLKIFLSLALFCSCVFTSFSFNNPVYLWLNQALSKRFPVIPVFASFDREAIKQKSIKVGDVLKVADLDSKDISCANKVISIIPDEATVSGPDYLGAHLSMRETYAIFPALYNSADYVIVDVFSRKIFTILGIDAGLVREVVFDVLKDPNYELQMGCGNLFVFKKVGPHGKSEMLPLQEKFTYTPKVNYEIFNGIYLVDYQLPSKLERGKVDDARFVYNKQSNPETLDSYVLYMTYMNEKTGEIYQAVNLPTFSIAEPEEWVEGYYYIEDIKIALPKYLQSGKYRVFIGMSNKIRTRNLFIGNIEVL